MTIRRLLRRKGLIIEDNPAFIKMVTDILHDHVRLLHATDAEKGLKIAQNKSLSFILLDIVMPGMDGLEALKELKSNKRTCTIPVFMLTSEKTIGRMEDAFQLGAIGYFVKTHNLTTLYDRIRKHIG
jgi:putative two-component system response regulator